MPLYTHYGLIEYKSPQTIDMKFDELIEKIGKKHGGRWVGQGTCLADGIRDVQIEFENEDAAVAFSNEVAAKSGKFQLEKASGTVEAYDEPAERE